MTRADEIVAEAHGNEERFDVSLTERQIRLLHFAMEQTMDHVNPDLFLELKNLKDGLHDEFSDLDLNRSFLD